MHYPVELAELILKLRNLKSNDTLRLHDILDEHFMKKFIFDIENDGMELEDEGKGKPYGQYIEDYEPLRKLGKGEFGEVHLVRRRQDGQLFAEEETNYVWMFYK